VMALARKEEFGATELGSGAAGSYSTNSRRRLAAIRGSSASFCKKAGANRLRRCSKSGGQTQRARGQIAQSEIALLLRSGQQMDMPFVGAILPRFFRPLSKTVAFGFQAGPKDEDDRRALRSFAHRGDNGAIAIERWRLAYRIDRADVAPPGRAPPALEPVFHARS